MSTGANEQNETGAERSGDPRRATARAARVLVNAMARPGGETLAWLKGPATEWVSELVGVRVELAEVDPLGSVAMPTEREEESRAATAKRGVRKTPLPDGLPPFPRTTGAGPSLERERTESMPGTPAVDRLARERAQAGRGSAGSRFGPSGPVRLARASRGGDAAVPPAGLAEQDSRAVELAPSQTPADGEATSSLSSAAMIASQHAKSGGGSAVASRIPTGGAMALLARLVDAAEAARGSANSAETSRTTESREMTPAKVVREGTPQADGREPSRGVIGPALSAVGRMGIRSPASDQDASGLGSRGMAGLSAGAAALPPVDPSDVADLIAEALDEEARRSGIDVGVQG